MFATATAVHNTQWLEFYRPRPEARVRLFCFPYAGGSALIFRDWQDSLPEFIEVWPIQLPARGKRVAEPPIREVPRVVDALQRELPSPFSMPYALFGHSMGALLAFELARYGESIGRPPVHLFIGARGAPHLPQERKTCRLPDDEFIEELRRIGATPNEILSDPDLVRFFLPTVRADFQLAQEYNFVDAPPISCPIVALAGRTDREVSLNSMNQWSRHTRARHSLHLFPQGHFFLKESQPQVLALLASELSRALSHRGGVPF